MKQTVAYYRVSTSRQGKSGLGLEAQQMAVKNYCKLNKFNIIREVIEVKSTRKCRVKLIEALELCEKNGFILIVARLDRLGRDLEQICRIVKSNVEIIFTDNPKIDRFTLHILAAVAEEQRKRISEVTKEALDAAKRRGVILGKNGKALSEANKKAAEAFAHKLSPLLVRLKNKGITTVRAVSEELNKRGIPTFRGEGRWHPNTVHVLMKRLKEHTNTKTFSTMKATTENDILFDDFSILTKLTGKNELINVSSNNDCDCTSYTSTSNQDDFNTYQVTSSSGKTN